MVVLCAFKPTAETNNAMTSKNLFIILLFDVNISIMNCELRNNRTFPQHIAVGFMVRMKCLSNWLRFGFCSAISGGVKYCLSTCCINNIVVAIICSYLKILKTYYFNSLITSAAKVQIIIKKTNKYSRKFVVFFLFLQKKYSSCSSKKS